MSQKMGRDPFHKLNHHRKAGPMKDKPKLRTLEEDIEEHLISMRTVLLTGITKRAKQIVKTHGREYDVIEVRQAVLFDKMPGPWAFIRTTGGSDARWVHLLYDSNFEVTDSE